MGFLLKYKMCGKQKADDFEFFKCFHSVDATEQFKILSETSHKRFQKFLELQNVYKIQPLDNAQIPTILRITDR